MLSLGSKRGNGPSGKAQAIEFVDKLVLVAGARNQRYLRLVEQEIPKLAA